MTSNMHRTIGLAAALLLTASISQAQGHSQDKDKGKSRDHERYPSASQGKRVPPGLAKKPGGMPPGQYKKRYGTSDGVGVLRDILIRRGYTVVRTDRAGPSEYVYYRLRDGGVRRAVVSPGTDQLAFSNVPASLLREVLARLY